MKILICTSGYNGYDDRYVTVFALDQAKALRDYGHDVRIAEPDIRSIRRWRPWSACEYKIDGIKAYTANFPCGRMPNKIKQWCGKFTAEKTFRMALADGWKPDIVHAHFLDIGSYFVDIVKNAGYCYVMTEHSSSLVAQNISKYEIELGCKTYSKVDKLLAVSQSLTDSIKKHMNVKGEVVWNIVDTGVFAKRKRNENLLKFSFLSCGALIRRKGFDCLIKSFTALHSNAELIIMGDGPERSNLEDLARQLGVSDRVCFTGKYKREQMAEELAKANCFVLASRFETFGVVYIEAMAAGVPVIATDCGGPRDFVNDKVGVLVPVDNVEALRQAMQDMIDGKVKYDSEEIRQYALDNFSPRVIAERLTKVYEEVLENK